MKTFRHSGKIGDCIFSLPAIKTMRGGILYLPEQTHECPALYSQLKTLLEQQEYITEVREYHSMLGYGEQAEGIHIDVDLDQHREHPLRGKVNMVQRYAEIFNIELDHTKPWLTVEGPRMIDHEYNLINLTPRFRENSRVDWKSIYRSISKPVYFIGTKEEHANFVEKIGAIERLPTDDLLTFALFIRDCSTLFCNQSCALAIAQSLSKPYYCEFKPLKRNCFFYTPNEHQLL